MRKFLSSVKLTKTLTMSTHKDGFWLHDKTRGMNLAMQAETETQAFVKALTYYQNRLSRIEADHASLKQKVDIFVSQFADDSEEL